jgi:hypothetical protein
MLIFLIRRRFVTETFCSGDVFMETFCQGGVLCRDVLYVRLDFVYFEGTGSRDGN